MKKALLLLFSLMLCVCAAFMVACGDTGSTNTGGTSGAGGGEEDNQPSLTTITGVVFENQTFDYDGLEKVITVNESAIPTGVTVAYTNNKATNAGEYNATAVLTGEGYKTLTLTAKLKINKINYDMSNARWNYSSAFTYDGSDKSVTVTGLPDGVTVKQYTDNTKKNAGTYTAKVSFNYDTVNHNAPTIADCTWTIDQATMNVTAASEQKLTEDGNNHLPKLEGVIPSGVTVQYYFDDVLKGQGENRPGKYEVKIVLSGKNYKTVTLTVAFKISVNALELVKKVFASFGNTPNPWSFLPDSFNASNKTITTIPDYSNFVNVSSIPTNGIGKQLSVVYNTLNKTSKAISYVQPVYDVLGTIKELYTTFIDDNPEEYKEFSSTAKGISFTLLLTEEEYLISASVKNIAVKIFGNTKENSYGARVQLATDTVIKYTVSENQLKLAWDIKNTCATMISFVRDNNQVLGYMYEYLGIGDKQITATSALIHVNNTYTTLIGTKGDFIPTAVSRNCEVYRNSDAKLVGTEVREELDVKALGLATYNTLWYNLSSLDGIDSIKKEDNENGLNKDTIYINNATKAIHTKTVSVLPSSKKAYSRRFDIEFKTMYFYTYNTTKEEYEQVEAEIPMLFIQEEQFDTFEEDFYDKNKDYLDGEVSLNITTSVKNAVNYGYYTLLVEYD